MIKVATISKMAVALCVLCGCLGVGADSAEQQAGRRWLHIEQSQHNRDQRMAWWRDAKFGMFIHWGLYAIPAGVWEGKQYDGIGEWIMAHAEIPVEEYRKLAGQFNPTKFDAAEWVRIARDAGMKYIVITSKHHDGFCMFDSRVTEYDIVDATPYGKDVLKALSAECRKAGIKFCTYYSILDWQHPAQMPSDKPGRRKYSRNAIRAGRKQEYKNYLKAQLTELVRRYDPAVLWFDGGWMDWWQDEDGREIVDYLWSISPGIIINNRATGKSKPQVADYGTPEQRIPKEGSARDFETCMTMNDTWGYKVNDHNWKTTGQLIANLVDIVSKGGNYLLNVGPTAEGLIPQPSVERLQQIGNWLKVNGEAIYGCRKWKTYRQPAGDAGGVEIRFTTKDNAVYATCLDWPRQPVVIRMPHLDAESQPKIRSVEMLGSQEQLQWSQKPGRLVVTPPKKRPCDYVYVFKIVLE